MKNKEYFLRDDLSTYKKKFLRLCNKYEIEKLVQKFDNSNNKSYVCRIKIKEINYE